MKVDYIPDELTCKVGDLNLGVITLKIILPNHHFRPERQSYNYDRDDIYIFKCVLVSYHILY